MQEQLVSVITAQLAKKKGFNEEFGNYTRFLFYDEWGYFRQRDKAGINSNSPIAVSQSFLQKWLREKHNLHVSVYLCFSQDDLDNIQWYFNIEKFKKGDIDWLDSSEDHFVTYEEAFEAGLQEGLKLI